MTDDDLRKLFDESKRHTETVYERTRSDVQQLAEGLLTLSEKMDRGFNAMRSGFTEVNARIEVSVSQLATRIQTLEQRVERLESHPRRAASRQSVTDLVPDGERRHDQHLLAQQLSTTDFRKSFQKDSH